MFSTTRPAHLRRRREGGALAGRGRGAGGKLYHVSAAARGLGTCWVGLGSHIRNSQLLGEINLSAEQRIIAPIILGYPRSVPAPSERRAPQILRVIAEAR
jgi:nitroreductase